MRGYSGKYDAKHEWMIFFPGTWDALCVFKPGRRGKLELMSFHGYGTYFSRRLAETLIERHYARYGERLEMRYMR